MKHTTLQKNLEKLIQDQDFEVTELERKAGLKRNSVYNILKGLSKKPSAETLQTLSDVLGVTVKDLFSSVIETQKHLTEKNLNLIKSIIDCITEEMKQEDLQLTYIDLSYVVKEVFDYSITSNLDEPDKKFVHWLLLQKNFKK